MTDVVGICNMALANIGSYVPIQSLQERSKEARACAQFYDHCLEMMLRDYAWSFSLRRGVLADLGDPPPGWQWRYQYPADALFIKRLGSYTFDNHYDDFIRQYEQFMVIGTESGKAILSNIEDANVVYCVIPENPNVYPAFFVDALSWLISSRIAMGITGDKGMLQQAMQMYRLSWEKAVSRDLQESAEPPRLEAESIRVRDINVSNDRLGDFYNG